MPALATNSDARPLVVRIGAPESERSTSTSRIAKLPIPTPSAFIVASFAAKRAASPGTGSTRLPHSSCSAWVKTRSIIRGRRSRTSRKRAMSTVSRPIEIIYLGRRGAGGASLDRHDLGEVSRTVDVVAPGFRDRVREDLHRHDVDYRTGELARRRHTE